MRLTDGRTDGQTDRQTEFSSLDRVCIPCSAVKTNGAVFCLTLYFTEGEKSATFSLDFQANAVVFEFPIVSKRINLLGRPTGMSEGLKLC